MTDKMIFSKRHGLYDKPSLTLDALIELVANATHSFRDLGFLDEAMGPMGDSPNSYRVRTNTMGPNVELYFFRKTGKRNMFPVIPNGFYSKEDIFDILEIIHDHVSEFDNVWDCFDKQPAQLRFRTEVNEFLNWFEEGWEITTDGYVCRLPIEGFRELVEEDFSSGDGVNITSRIKSAIALYRRRVSTLDDKRDAIRGLGDVLEYIQKSGNLKFTKKHESDLFHILNRFGIRHHKPDQETDYDNDIFFDWMFYHYLAAVHAAVRLMDRSK